MKTLLSATMAIGLMTGGAFAQSSSSSSTTVTTPAMAPTHDLDVTETTKRTADRHGVTVEKETTGTEVITPGSPGSTQTRTDTTTVK
jgi:hypothetical protein